MGNLVLQAKKSPLLNIEIQVGKEIIKFNLPEELAIDKKNSKSIQNALQNQPTIYSYLTVIHTKFVVEVEKCKNKKEAIWGKRLLYYSTSKNSKFYKKNGRFPTKDMAEALVENDKEYRRVCRQLLNNMQSKGVLESCVKAFEQRASLLQTISANIRSESKL